MEVVADKEPGQCVAPLERGHNIWLLASRLLGGPKIVGGKTEASKKPSHPPKTPHGGV